VLVDGMPMLATLALLVGVGAGTVGGIFL